MGLIDEIGEQPGVSRRLLQELPTALAPLVADVRDRGVRFVVVAARGTSDHAGVYAQYALGGLARLPVGLATPSLVTRYATPPRFDGALVVGISQSGRSPDVVGVVAEAARQGAVTAAITNDPGSPLADAADHLLPLLAGEERSVAATKTYTAELLVVAMLASVLADDPALRRAELERLPAVQEAALSLAADAASLADAHAGMSSCVVLGRGYNLATALEWALKLKELAGIQAQAYSTADFQHGPVASLAAGGDILAVRAPGPMLAELDDLLDRLRAERRVRIVAVSAAASRPGIRGLVIAEAVPEWLTPLVTILPAQLFTAALASAKGLDLERPRGLNKVTLTR